MITISQRLALEALRDNTPGRIAASTLKALAKRGLIARTGENGRYQPTEAGENTLAGLLKDSRHVTGVDAIRSPFGAMFGPLGAS